MKTTVAMALLLAAGLGSAVSALKWASPHRPPAGRGNGSARVRRAARKARNVRRNRAAHR